MKKLPTASDSIASGTIKAHPNSSLYLIVSMIDTTWRVFVPTVGLLLLGNYLDDRAHSSPWLMLLGAVVGGGIAALLVKRQLAKGRGDA
jgi:F0F1-type ATP synthase assembly protein I